MKKLYLVDVSAMFFRAFYAVRMLTNSKGMPTNAIYGFLSMSVKLLKEEKPDYMAYCFDRKEASFRKDLDPNYKANRGETPEELIPQIPYIKTLSEMLGIPCFEKEKYEADDIIGSLAKLGEKEKLEVVIVSGDKDFAQLINNKITMYDTMKDRHFDPDMVMEKWGVRPDQFIDYLAICGDSSDNIPGVKGIGPKGAEKLLSQFETLENIYENLDKIKNPGHVKKLEASKEDAFLSKKLVTIVNDLKLIKDLKELTLSPIDNEKLEEVLDELEFQSFKKNLLGGGASKQAAKSQSQVKSVDVQVDKASAKDLDKWLQSGEEVLAYSDSRITFLCKDSDCKQIDDDLSKVGEVLKSKNLKWKGFDVKSIWRELGIPRGEVKEDLMLSAYLLKAGAIKSFSETYSLYCGGGLPEFPQPTDIVNAFNELEDILAQRLKEYKMTPILQTLDLPLIEVLASMEAKGVELDTQFLAKESKVLEGEILELTKQIHHEAGEEFNIASPKQLGVILFDKMGLPPGKKTKTGYSTATDVLDKLKADYPICEKVIEFRELSKLKSTYVDALPEIVNSKTKRVHTIFNQALTTTGRLSSNHPNLQNIPIRTERGRKVREAFVAPKGHLLLSADYSQIELRVLAHITKDPGLIAAFTEDRDIHAWTASEIFGVPIDDVTSEKRRMAKAVNFGIAYGQGVYGLAETLQIPRKESKQIIEDYFEKFPGVKEYMETIVESAKEKTYVETLFGRRRYIPELFAKSPMQRSFGERAAINAPIQGTASDLVKMAMLEVFEDYSDSLILQVHDELMFELPEKGIEDHAERIKEIMENSVSLEVPLKVNVSWGKNWSEAH